MGPSHGHCGKPGNGRSKGRDRLGTCVIWAASLKSTLNEEETKCRRSTVTDRSTDGTPDRKKMRGTVVDHFPGPGHQVKRAIGAPTPGPVTIGSQTKGGSAKPREGRSRPGRLIFRTADGVLWDRVEPRFRSRPLAAALVPTFPGRPMMTSRSLMSDTVTWVLRR